MVAKNDPKWRDRIIDGLKLAQTRKIVVLIDGNGEKYYFWLGNLSESDFKDLAGYARDFGYKAKKIIRVEDDRGKCTICIRRSV